MSRFYFEDNRSKSSEGYKAIRLLFKDDTVWWLLDRVALKSKVGYGGGFLTFQKSGDGNNQNAIS
jgi:hypothetical protein